MLAQLARQRFDLTAGRPQIAGQCQDSNEQAAALDVIGVTAEVLAQDLDRIALAVLARQRGRALERGWPVRRASGYEGRNDQQRTCKGHRNSSGAFCSECAPEAIS